MSQKLYFEDLHVYQDALKFLGLANNIVEQLPRGNATIIDQLKRASLSIVLNIAEGAGKMSRADARKFYGIARGSALECSAALDSCETLKIVDIEQIRDGKQTLVNAVKMLTVMCRAESQPKPKLE